MSVASCAILSNFFEEQGRQNHPKYLSGLSRALFSTTFLETAVYALSLTDAVLPLWQVAIRTLACVISRGVFTFGKMVTFVNFVKAFICSKQWYNVGAITNWICHLEILLCKTSKSQQHWTVSTTKELKFICPLSHSSHLLLIVYSMTQENSLWRV